MEATGQAGPKANYPEIPDGSPEGVATSTQSVQSHLT